MPQEKCIAPQAGIPETIETKLRFIFDESMECSEISHGIRTKLYGSIPKCNDEKNGREPCIESLIDMIYEKIIETKRTLQDINKGL